MSSGDPGGRTRPRHARFSTSYHAFHISLVVLLYCVCSLRAEGSLLVRFVFHVFVLGGLQGSLGGSVLISLDGVIEVMIRRFRLFVVLRARGAGGAFTPATCLNFFHRFI
ncbi:unnamed protein product [Ectocarpus sp. 6 AP-2014]